MADVHRRRDGSVSTYQLCGEFVSWWEGEYEGECELPKGHDGDHYDGLSWFNDAHENTGAAHRG